jgi:hypothetical protein
VLVRTRCRLLRTGGSRVFQDRRCRYWPCKLAPCSQRLHPFSISTFEPRGSLIRTHAMRSDSRLHQTAAAPSGSRLKSPARGSRG